MSLARPLFIVFEGIDGSGKTTLADMLFDHYRAGGVPAVRLREPTDGEWGRRIREMLKGEEAPRAEEQLRLFLLDREDDVKRNIRPMMAEKRLILMDRYYFSNAAYQGAAGLPPDTIISENRKRGFPEPDRVYLVDIDPEEALRRIGSRNGGMGKELFEKKFFLERVREIYLSLAGETFRVLDGSLSPGTLLGILTGDMEEGFSLKV